MAALALFLAGGFIGCSDETVESAGHPAVERFALSDAEPEGVSGFSSLARMEYDLFDVPATPLLDAVGLPLPPSAQGRSLMGYLDPSRGAGAKPMVFSEVDYIIQRFAVRTKEWKIIHNPKDEQRPYELYSLVSDPGEEKDLAGASPVFEGMRERMEKFRRNLDAFSDSLKGSGDQAARIDPRLMDALRAQGYVK